MKQIKLYQDRSHLLGSDYWDANLIDILSFELQFIWNNTNDFISTKVDLMTVYNQVAMKSNQKYSFQRDIEVLVI